MNTPAFRLAALAGLATLLVASAAPARGFVDVLNQPATTSALASQRLLLATAVAGKRLVAAGARGHVIYSDDAGRSWQQARVPVSADLTASSIVARDQAPQLSTAQRVDRVIKVERGP